MGSANETTSFTSFTVTLVKPGIDSEGFEAIAVVACKIFSAFLRSPSDAS